MRRIAPCCALIAAAALVAGCSSGPDAADPVVSEGTLSAAPGSPAVTYDPQQAPEGAVVRVETVRAADSVTATLRVQGLQPDRGYAVHLHDDPCGPDGDDAGGHFQHQLDPAATADDPSTDPVYANPQNEFWLDIRTDAQGAATAAATTPFALADRAPQSLIIHEEEVTNPGPEDAGTAGDRLACLTVTT